LPQDGWRGGGGGRGWSREEKEERAVLGEWTSAGVAGRDVQRAESSGVSIVVAGVLRMGA
jgi:hypothetical protein